MNPQRPPEITDDQIRSALTRRPDPQRMADDLAFIAAAVERTPQRRWLPARLSFDTARLRSSAALLAVLAVLVALAIAFGVIVGSPQKLPPPFGLAKSGLVAFDQGGQIYVANPDGTGRTQLTSGSDRDSGPNWSPDGTRIAYQSQQADLSLTLIVMDPDGRNRVTIADQLAATSRFVWSPDSRRIAFGARLVGSDVSHIYLADADRPGAVPLAAPDVYGVEPSWSPDGTQIVFKRLDRFDDNQTGLVLNQRSASVGLWLIGADGSNSHRLSSTTGADAALWGTVWSPDSKRLAFISDGLAGERDVYVINADGTGERNISNSPEREGFPSWSPDGRRIAFARDTEGSAGPLIVVDPDGSHATQLSGPLINSNPMLNSNTPVWSPDGTRLLGYAMNPDLNDNSAIVVFDASDRAPAVTIPAEGFTSASWQRLAP